jgi:acetolactate synthase-1/2/3 large subunit
VVLALPEDVLAAETDAPDAPPARPAQAEPSEAAVEAIVHAVAEAERPVAIVGGPGWSARAAADLAAFAAVAELPVTASFRRQDHLDNRHPCWAGPLGLGSDPALIARIREADLLLVIGTRLGEIATGGYTLLSIPAPRQRLIHAHPDPDEIGRVHRPELAVAAASAPLLARLAAAARPPARRREAALERARAAAEAWRRTPESPGALKLERVVAQLSEALPDDAILTNGAGNFAAWLHRGYLHRGFRTQLAPTSGSMGYGLPAAVAAKLAHPDREVICLAGDGDFQMTMQEFGTAAQHGAAVIVLVADNRRFGTIRMHQERRYPGRVCGTEMVNPDFTALARSYGAHAETVTEDRAFSAALDRARKAGRLALLHLKLDPRALSPSSALG